jgi:hypothetical protein
MPTRRNKGQPPQVTFTADFHELVQGDLIPGPARIRYDPFRIVPTSEFKAARSVHCFVELRPLNQRWEKEMQIPPSSLLAYNWDPAGQGFMLEETFDLPRGCDELEFWFSYREPNGNVRWDSAEGKNFRIRFPLHDLIEPQGRVLSSPDPAFDRLQVGVQSIAKVESVLLRWRLTHPSGHPRQESQLVRSQAGNQLQWSTPDGGLPVPVDATAVFDLVYRVGGRSFTDDNAGSWYLAAPQAK